MEELLMRMRLLEVDHEPDGWPAVEMRDITALLDEIDRRCIKQDRVNNLEKALRDTLRQLEKAINGDWIAAKLTHCARS